MASQVSGATGGVLSAGANIGDPGGVVVDGASFDSRSLEPGQLFVPLVAERDGHDFIASAVARGATAYLTSHAPRTDVAATAIKVDDTAVALMSLAAFARRRLDIPVVAVTGSVGKTSTKDLIAAGLNATRLATANERSFNNEQGLPVTILGAPDATAALVVEMGMRGFGEITRLCEVADPTIGVVTAVAASHTERVGGIDGVFRAKRELPEWLGADHTAVLNADDELVLAMRPHTRASVLTYGLDGDVRVSGLVLDELARPRFRVETPWGAHDLRLAISGRHMAFNAAAAIAVAGVVEDSIDAAVEAIELAAVSGKRMELARSSSGAIIINDAYNANPDSMRAALDALAAVAAERRFAVLGPMAELDDPPAGHRQVAADAAARGIEIITVGTSLYGPDPVADAVAALAAQGAPGANDAVLVKASNSAQLWTVAESLLA